MGYLGMGDQMHTMIGDPGRSQGGQEAQGESETIRGVGHICFACSLASWPLWLLHGPPPTELDPTSHYLAL